MKKVFLIVGIIAAMYAVHLQQGFCENASVVSVEGSVDVSTTGVQWAKATAGMLLGEGAIIKTGPDSKAVIRLEGGEEGADVELKPNSNLTLSELFKGKDAADPESHKTLLDLSVGEVLIKAKKLQSEKSKFEVKTPTSIVGVRGTTFSVTVES
ncbi:MAG: FecR domain-containing protein [Candidatus Omnitrophica bacterium]|nr:FecR domain-containing protein [Candidatus Omnitrophota bacterium]